MTCTVEKGGINPLFCEVRDFYNAIGAEEYGVIFSEV